MGFKDLLRRALDETPGALLCTLMGNDGIAIDTVETDSSIEREITNATIELTSLLGQVRTSTSGLKSGPLKELMVAGQDLLALVRPLTDDYFIALLMEASGNTGKARYLMRVISPKLLEELG